MPALTWLYPQVFVLSVVEANDDSSLFTPTIWHKLSLVCYSAVPQPSLLTVEVSVVRPQPLPEYKQQLDVLCSMCALCRVHSRIMAMFSLNCVKSCTATGVQVLRDRLAHTPLTACVCIYIIIMCINVCACVGVIEAKFRHS